MTSGLFLVAAGVGLLVTARAFREDAQDANAAVLAERGLPPRVGRWLAKANTVFGVLLGIAAMFVGFGLIIADLVD